MTLVVTVGAFIVMSRMEQFLISDPRLRLPGPPDPGIASPNFRITGLSHAPEDQVIQTFERDFGRSLYLCPIAERRRSLLAIDWVKDASVLRIWPNSLDIRITERTPVAFAQIPNGPSMHFSLIDADGVLLAMSKSNEYHLPVLVGITAADSERIRRERVRRMLRLQSEIGARMDKVSEVDITDMENVKISEEFNHRMLVLMLGNQNFSTRLENFTSNYSEIRKRMPEASAFDLRLPDRITAVGGM